MTGTRIFFAIAAGLLLCGLARADQRKAPAMPAPEGTSATIYSFGRENPDCGEWTNACQVCTRDASGTPQCSTSGIACTPGVPVCRVRKAP
jgi:hypothetical protein